jgi:hypothetical protein
MNKQNPDFSSFSLSNTRRYRFQVENALEWKQVIWLVVQGRRRLVKTTVDGPDGKRMPEYQVAKARDL